MKALLHSTGLFTASEIELFLKKGIVRTFAKGENLLREGGVCREVGFIQSGFFRSYYYNSSGEEVTYCFGFPHSLIGDYASFVSEMPAKESIEAMTDTQVLLFSRTYILEMEQHPNWLLFFKQLADAEFIRLENRFFSQMKETAEFRYRKMVADHSEYLRLIPLSHQASYLGISQRHLIRIRKNWL